MTNLSVFLTSVLDEMFDGLQQKLRLDLQIARKKYSQSTDIGTEYEMAIRDVLGRHLPAWVSVGQGEIIDSGGQRSRQTDIVIANEDQPFRVGGSEPCIYLIEGVAAAGEAKSRLTSGNLDEALRNSSQFKLLRPLTPTGTVIRSNPSDLKRFIERPPWFIIADSSDITLERIREKAEAHIGGKGWDINQTLDAVFVLDRGYVINFGDGHGTIGFRRQDGSVQQGWGTIEDPKSVLATLIVWLSACMPKMNMLDPIIGAYCKK